MRYAVPEIDQIVELVRLASCELPSDVLAALRRSRGDAVGSAASTIEDILSNCAIAAGRSVPMCQDTGLPSFFVSGPGLDYVDRIALVDRCRQAVAVGVKSGLLRPNAVDVVSGVNTGDGTGFGIPQIYFDDPPAGSPAAPLRIDLLLKGGGSENVGRQYSLPEDLAGAGRDMDGVRACVIDAVVRAQGFGCAPGIIGVCVGGDRSSGAVCAKRQLLRRLDGDRGPFHDFEDSLLDAINSLGIGPMGLGGSPTALGVAVAVMARHPACFFVSISYGCWATRRRAMVAGPDGSCVYE